MFENRHEPLLPLGLFVLRVIRNFVIVGGLIAGALAIGTFGYRHTEGLSWLDSLYNAAMILTGMGPPTELKTRGGKLFASAYALFSGVVFLSSVAVVIAPVAHRLLHRFHLDTDEERT